MSPYYTERRPNHNLMYTVDHTFGYRSKKLICACAKSSAHAHGTKIRGRKQGNGRFATDLQGFVRTSDGDPRTGTFHRMRFTAGDTTCSVKGV